MLKHVVFICIVPILTGSLLVSFDARNERKGPQNDKITLGSKLFHDPLLSADRSISCASCHIPEYAFSDTVAFSVGVGGKIGKRNAQGCTNLSGRPYFFFDGRAATLEDQVHFPIEDPNEMANTMANVIQRLNSDTVYPALFKQLYNEPPNSANIADAIAAFERSLETANSPFDRYMNGTDSLALSPAAERGRVLFMGSKAKCFDCHFSPDFTGDEYRNIGLFDGKKLNDSGRYLISHIKSDIGKFRVPGLRNVSVTAPYMHNGIFKTLKEVIEYYNNPYKVVRHPVNMDTLMLKPLGLTAREKEDLEAFLLTLTDDRFNNIATLCIMLGSIAATVLLRSPWVFPALLVAAGSISNFSNKRIPATVQKPKKINWNNLWLFVTLFIAAGILSELARSEGWKHRRIFNLFENFYRFGTIVFGGGQALLSYMLIQFSAVSKIRHSANALLTPEQLSLGYGMVQAVPGPVFSVCTYVGGMAMGQYGPVWQLAGCIVATVAIFLPSTLLLFFFFPIYENLKHHVIIFRALEGINAAIVGIIWASGIVLFQSIAPFDWANVVVVVITFSLLHFSKIASPLIVLGWLLMGLTF